MTVVEWLPTPKSWVAGVTFSSDSPGTGLVAAPATETMLSAKRAATTRAIRDVNARPGHPARLPVKLFSSPSIREVASRESAALPPPNAPPGPPEQRAVCQELRKRQDRTVFGALLQIQTEKALRLRRVHAESPGVAAAVLADAERCDRDDPAVLEQRPARVAGADPAAARPVAGRRADAHVVAVDERAVQIRHLHAADIARALEELHRRGFHLDAVADDGQARVLAALLRERVERPRRGDRVRRQ